ncbi:hypothetical protein IE53DRAFT_380445 [Violaceomyces palustris]|uniref:Uncharacterized protein n=1 Tax=Violaceomyces palustris TaxID=1673888 RepID=A0ACD0NUN7_9BASI|nr:hypothetical protein IE53DRAFT_380445 [Violaceomyces palustris]
MSSSLSRFVTLGAILALCNTVANVRCGYYPTRNGAMGSYAYSFDADLSGACGQVGDGNGQFIAIGSIFRDGYRDKYNDNQWVGDMGFGILLSQNLMNILGGFGPGHVDQVNWYFKGSDESCASQHDRIPIRYQPDPDSGRQAPSTSQLSVGEQKLLEKKQ